MSGLELLLEAAAGRDDAVRASVGCCGDSANCGASSSSASVSVASSEASVHREALLANFLKVATAAAPPSTEALPAATTASFRPASYPAPSASQPALTRRVTSCSSLPPKKRLRLGASAANDFSKDFGLRRPPQRRDSVTASTLGLQLQRRGPSASSATSKAPATDGLANASSAKSSRDSLADLRSNFLGSFAKIPSAAFASSPTMVSDITEGSGSGTKNAEFGTFAERAFREKKFGKLGPFTVVVPAKGKKGSKADKKRRGKAGKALRASQKPIRGQTPFVLGPRCPRSKKDEPAVKDTDGNDIGMGYFSMLSRGASPPVASTASTTETSEADSTDSASNSLAERRPPVELEKEQIQRGGRHEAPQPEQAARAFERSQERCVASAAKAKAELYEAYLRALG